jgi:hypothetical protein
MNRSLLLVAAAALASLAAGCGKPSEAATRSDVAAAAPAGGSCGHAVCGGNYFIDATPPAACPVNEPCAVAIKLVATGDFHINDEYPYRFKADEAAGVEFLGTDGGGKNVFSKTAGDWQKTDAKSGVVTVKLKATQGGPKTIAGTFKLSVCSAQNCLLEQPQVSTSVAAR